MTDPRALLRGDLSGFEPYVPGVPDKSLVRLHANEVPWRHGWDDSEIGLNRYPDPAPTELAVRLAGVYGVAAPAVLLTRGSDDAIDVIVRAFCHAGQDRILVSSPTFGMYAVAARLQGAGVVDVPLAQGHALDVGGIVEAVAGAGSRPVKLVFVCSPNNPTGNRQDPEVVRRLAGELAGRAVVVVDEAYQEFSTGPSLAAAAEAGELLVLRTLSKAYGLAGARLGAVIGRPDLLAVLRGLLPPYLLPAPSVEAALRMTRPADLAAAAHRACEIVGRRDQLAGQLADVDGVDEVLPSDANFLLVRFADAAEAFDRCTRAGLLVRDFSRRPGLEGCLRITVGSESENRRLLEALTAVAHV